MSLAAIVNAYFNGPDRQVPRMAVLGAQLVVDSFHRYDLEGDAIYLHDVMVLTHADVLGYARRIDFLNQGAGKHRAVLQDIDWRMYYSVAPRPFLHVTQHHPFGVQKQLDSAPCSGCGICLPLTLLQIDHVHPMAGAALPPIMKVFRSLGLTLGPPKGKLGQGALLNHLSDGVGSVGVSANRKLAKGNFAMLQRQPKPLYSTGPGSKLRKRYSTNEMGNAFLSLCWQSGNGMEQLTTACRNSVLNLRPLCSNCNILKADTARVEAV